MDIRNTVVTVVVVLVAALCAIASSFVADPKVSTALLMSIPTLLALLVPSPLRPSGKPPVPPLALLVLALGIVGCGIGRTVCPIIHVADEICPLVLVDLPDGGQEPLPAAEVQRLALRHRAARLAVDGGVR